MFGTFAQQDYFEYPSVGAYSGVLINANMAAHAPLGLATFLLEKTHNTIYMIDPLTHAFQHDPEMVCNGEGQLKSSLKILADAYGGPVQEHAGITPLLPKHFADDSIVRKFAQACLDFQSQHLCNKMVESDAAKYLDDNEICVAPYAFVVPYFYMSETTVRKWLPLNIKLAQVTASLRPEGSKIFCSIVIDRGVLEARDTRTMLIEQYKSLDVDGYLIWIDDFDEQKASLGELEALKNIGSGLRMGGLREVINTHGGYYSVLLASRLGNESLSGVAHGPEFGEYRGVVPVGGGIPIARYYVPALHSRIRYRDTLRIFRSKGWLDSPEAFHENVCGCTVCRETLRGDAANFALFGESESKQVRRRNGIVSIDFPTKRTKELCLKHYLQMKHREFEAASNADNTILMQNLINGIKIYEDVIGLDGVAHLRRWLLALGCADAD